MIMKRIEATELANMLGVNPHAVLEELRNLHRHWYRFLRENIKGEGEKFLIFYEDALAICDIFNKNPKLIGLTKHKKVYDIVLDDDLFIPTYTIKGKEYYEDWVLRYFFQIPINTKRWIQLRRRYTEIKDIEHFIYHEGRIYFTREGALKMVEERKNCDDLKRKL